MIETIIRKKLSEKLNMLVVLEKEKTMPDDYVLIDTLSSTKNNLLKHSKYAFQSYSTSLFKTAQLNEKVIEAVEGLIELKEISGIKLSSYYNFTDTETKEYRYQAVFDIYHY